MKLWHVLGVWLAALSIVAWITVHGLPMQQAAGAVKGETPLPVQPAAARAVPAAAPVPTVAGPRQAQATAPADVTAADGALGEWETFQRDSAHTGYVPAGFNPDLFTRKWEWQRTEGGAISAINAVATAPGHVVVSEEDYFGSPAVRVLRELDGAQVWEQVFHNYPALNPPAAAHGAVYVTTTGHEQTFLWGFAVVDGTPLIQASFSSQWANLFAPTVRGGRVFVSSGYYWDTLYAFDAVAGDRLWSAGTQGSEMSTPAVDEVHALLYGGDALNVYDVATGERLGSIPDPHLDEPGASYSYHGAPMMGRADSVTSFSGGAYGASSSAEHSGSRYLVNFSIAESRVRWRSLRRYKTHPATAHGVVYAGSNDPKSFDAIDEATGQVLWSWVPPPADVSFHRNVVVTENLVFVSTNRAVYALDLATRRPVWSYPVPGMLAISGGGTLYIVEGATESTGRLVAISLTGYWQTGGVGPRRRR